MTSPPNPPAAPAWEPATSAERYRALDVVRGAALFGVLLVNLLTVFRVSLFEHIRTFHTDPGWANHLTDALVAGVLEFKALTLFSFLFGVGMAIQAERAAPRGVNVARFLARRFTVLLALGLCHLLLIWNGDILTLYAVCGLLLIPLLPLPEATLAMLGAAVMVIPWVVSLGIPWPSQSAVAAHIPAATRIYSQGGFREILVLRWHETGTFILPLLLSTLPRTAGLMLWGVAAWRSGILREPAQYKRVWLGILVSCGLVGSILTALHVAAESAGRPYPVPAMLFDFGGVIPLAFAYAAALCLWANSRRPLGRAALAAAGQMALTNYLLQSLILGFVFYGYGLGLFGKMAPAPAALLGIALYAAQLAFSRAWLRRYRFGPCEWLWRSLTYGRRQPMRLSRTPAA